MNTNKRYSVETNVASGPEQLQTSRPLTANVETIQPGRLRLIRANPMRVLGISMLVIACLIPLLLSRFPPTNKQASPRAQLAHVEVVTVTARELYREITIVGKLAYGDGQIVHVSSPIAARVERVATRSTGDRVIEGEKLANIKSDPLLNGQQGLVDALEAFESSQLIRDSLGTNSARDSLWEARRKLLLLGVLPNQLTEIEQTRKVDGQLVVESRTAGTLLETRVRIGQQVGQGDVLFRVAKPDPMWLYVTLPVRDLPWVTLGRRVHVKTQIYPAKTFSTLITAVSAEVDSLAQTVRIGIPLPNPDGKLKHNTAANGTIRVKVLSDGTPEPTGLEGKFICSAHPQIVQDFSGDCPKDGLLLVHIDGSRVRQEPAVVGKPLSVPIYAVLDRHGRKLVRRLTSSGQIEIVDIKVGPRAQGRDDRGQETDYYPVRVGLKEGDRVFVGPNELYNRDKLVASGSTSPHLSPLDYDSHRENRRVYRRM